MSLILFLISYGINIAMLVNVEKWKPITRANSYESNLTLTLLIWNQNWSFMSCLITFLNINEWTKTELNLMSLNYRKYQKHVLSSIFNCLWVKVDTIEAMGFCFTKVIIFTKKYRLLSGNLNSPIYFPWCSSCFRFFKSLCQTIEKLLWR